MKDNGLNIIKFHFHSSSTISSRAVRWWTGGQYSHVSVEIDDNFYHSIVGKGLFIEKTIEKDVKATLCLALSNIDVIKIKETIDANVGDLYDIKAIIGFLLGIKFQSDDNWFCSELARYVIEHTLNYPIKEDSLVTPHEIYMVLKSYHLGINSK